MLVARGHCSSCLTDPDIANTITIGSGGSVAGEAIKTGLVGVGVGGTRLSTYVTGDLLYASSADVLEGLPIGATGQFLTVDPSGVPAWTNITSFAVATIKENDVVVSNVINAIDFLGGDFDVTESPVGEANVQLASTLTSVLGVSNNFNIGGTTLSFTGAGTVTSAGANSLTLDSGTTGTVNLGTGNNAKLINIGTGTAGNTINIATDNTIADTINIGSSLDIATIGAGLVIIPNGRLGIGIAPDDLDADGNPFSLEVAGSIGPSADDTYDLGSSLRRYANLYLTGTTTAGGDITIANSSPSVFFVDSDVGEDDFSVNANTSQFTIYNTTTGAQALLIASDGDVSLAGGSGTTGCTIDDATGNLVCSGNITSTDTSGTVGFFTRNNGTTTITSATAGDNLSTSGNILTTGAGTIVSATTLTAQAVTNQLVLGTGNTTTITSPAPAASRIATLPALSWMILSFLLTRPRL